MSVPSVAPGPAQRRLVLVSETPEEGCLGYFCSVLQKYLMRTTE